MLNLPNVTLLAFGNSDTEGNLNKAIDLSLRSAKFKETLIYTADMPSPGNVEFLKPEMVYQKIDRFVCKQDWCIWFMTQMPLMLLLEDTGSHILSIQWDGFPVNPDAWDDRFLEYDFVGPPWDDGVVGGSGMCLMSRNFLQALKALPINPTNAGCFPADALLFRTFFDERHTWRTELDAKGIKFAPADLARRFCVECEPYIDSFGFHDAGRGRLEEIKALGLYD